MAGILMKTFLELCTMFIVSGAADNATDIESIIQSKLSELPFGNLPPKQNATWPPLSQSVSVPMGISPPAAGPPNDSVTVVPSPGTNSSAMMNASRATAAFTPGPATRIPIVHTQMLVSDARTSTVDTPSMTTSLPTSLPPQSTSQTSPPPASHCSSCSSTAVLSTKLNTPGIPPTHGSLAVFLVVPVCIGLLISFFILFGKYCRKKLRLDKLRHQLMPMYSFDPAEGEDWETELLTDPRAQANHLTQATQVSRPTGCTEVPQLRFTPPVADV